MYWARILAFVTGMVDQELLARNEYLAAENRILKAQAKGWVIRPPLARVSCNGTQKVGMLMARSAL
jgi:putative transposase